MTTAELLAHGQTRESLRRAVRRGELIRVRRGAYCAAPLWATLDERERHLVRAAAVVADVRAPVLAGLSAAAVWDIPVLQDWPAEVSLLAPYRGGGRSEPGVRRTAIGARGAPVVRLHGLPVLSFARTVIEMAARFGFVEGVMAADFALRSGVPREELHAAIDARSSTYGCAVARASVDFASEAAENGGESAARAVIALLGFETPELQVVVVDRLGRMRVDFRWRRRDGTWIYGEFDGKWKYTRAEFNAGDPAEVAWREKKREDRLRVGSNGVVRILWSHVRDHGEMVALLSEAGVPGRSSARSDPSPAGAIRAEIQPSAQFGGK